VLTVDLACVVDANDVAKINDSPVQQCHYLSGHAGMMLISISETR
jgi:hypothetical protein